MASAAVMGYEPAFAPRAQWASRMRYEPALAIRPVPDSRELHEVWEHNFETEFNLLLAAVARAGGSEAILALDTEFPGFPYEDSRSSTQEGHYQVLRHNVDDLWPIQFGIAVVGTNGVHRGVWNFNLRFDAEVDIHTEESLDFLRAAGLDFPRHRTEGVSPLMLGQRLANCSLIGPHGRAPCWLTFSGSYDWGYLMKLVTLGRALPGLAGTFDQVLSVYCPKRRELRDFLPTGSLEKLGRKLGVKRWGQPHTAGSDALLTLELFMHLGGHKMEFIDGSSKQQEDAQNIISTKWQNDWSDISWHNNVEEWYQGDQGQWYADQILSGNDIQAASAGWENSTWTTGVQLQSQKIQMNGGAWGDNWGQQGQSNNDWWYSSGYQPTWFAAL